MPGLRHGFEHLDLGADVLDDGLDAAQFGRSSLLVQVVDRDVLRQRHLALCDSGEHVGLAGAVVAKQAVAAPLRQLEL